MTMTTMNAADLRLRTAANTAQTLVAMSMIVSFPIHTAIRNLDGVDNGKGAYRFPDGSALTLVRDGLNELPVEYIGGDTVAGVDRFYVFAATNPAGTRLSWYFDKADQARAAHTLASMQEGAEPSDVGYVDHVPAGDLVTSAGEFYGWVTGYVA